MKEQGQAKVFDLSNYPSAKQICYDAMEVRVEQQLQDVFEQIRKFVHEHPANSCYYCETKLLKQTVQALIALQFDVQMTRDGNYTINWGAYYDNVEDEDFTFQVSMIKRKC